MLAVSLFSAAQTPGSLSYPNNPRFTSHRFGEQFGIGVVTVTSLAQDHNGFLWIGTQTGLLRYDGTRVIRMSAAEPIVGHYIELVTTAPDNSVWVEGIRGVARYQNDQFVSVKIPEAAGSIDHTAQGLALDRNGNAFVVAERGLIRKNAMNPGPDHIFDKRDGVDCKVEVVMASPDNSIWFMCDHKLGHLMPNTDRPQWYRKMNLPDERPIALILDSAGGLWLRSSQHMDRIDPIHAKVLEEVGIAPANEEGGKPSLDQNGDLLVPSTAGLYWRDRGTWRVINEKDGLSSNVIQAALEDSEGTLWVGGFGTGLDHLTGMREWSAWTKAEGLPDNATWATQRDRQGRLWVATTHGIAIWDDKRQLWKTLSKANGLAGTETRQLALARDGSMWALASPGGITRIDTANFRMQVFASFEGEYEFLGVDPKGDIWATNRKQLVRFDGAARLPHPEAVPLAKNAERAMWYLDFSPGGVLWATGRSQIFRFDGKNWRVFTKQDGLLGSTVTSLTAVSDDEVWLGYNDIVGITKLTIDAQGQTHSQQYPWDYNIIGKDSKHRVWFNGVDGVTAVGADGSRQHFSQADGLIWDDLSPYGFREEANGSFLIATTRGLAHYVPNAGSSVKGSPDVMITAAKLGEENQNLDNRPRVDYQHGRFAAQFTPLLLNSSSETICRYRLAGLDSIYTETDQREVSYSHLPAGAYEFTVQCRTGSLPWNPRAARFSFSVLPPWWQSLWFRAASAMFAALLVWLIIRTRTHALNRRRQELEQAVAERNAELVEKNRELEQISLTDPLTRARNRRYFYEMIPADAAHVLRHSRGVSEKERSEPAIKELIFAMVDIDFFKFANDEHGHMAGDCLIQEIAKRLAELIRKSDVLVRWGGEEFLVVCRSTDRHNAPLLCSRILEAVSRLPYHLENAAEVKLTCSVGWAPFPWVPQAPDALTLEQVIEIADRALYIAKRTGRNHAVGLLPSSHAVRAPYDIRIEALRSASPAMADIVRTENPCGGNRGSKAASASGSSTDQGE